MTTENNRLAETEKKVAVLEERVNNIRETTDKIHLEVTNHIPTSIRRLHERIDETEKALGKAIMGINDKLPEMKIVKGVVFGMVGLILTAVILALVTLLFK